jgi:hypothetical protein
VEWATKGRNRIWIEGDDVKMWQVRSGLLNRCESGAFVWRDEWILTPSSPLPVLNRRLVGGRKRLMIMSGCHLRHFSFRASTIPSFLVLALLHGRTIITCMFALSSSPAYIYHILLEYRPVLLLKPLLCHSFRAPIKSSPFPPSTSTH